MVKRCIVLIISISFIFVSIIGRLYFLTLYNQNVVSNSYNSYSIMLDKRDINLYYSNGGRINNNVESYVAVIRPNSKCIMELNDLFPQGKKLSIINELKKGYPVIAECEYAKTKYIKIIKKSKTKTTLSQVISRESTGLLSYIDNSYGERKLNYSIDALGRMLQGDDGEIIDNNYSINTGYKLSINSNVQKIAYDACESIKSGCAIIMDIDSEDILAIVNKPDDVYLNKCFLQYPVGSVFKLLVTACAVENNIDLSYFCNGSIKVGDTIFSCQNKKAHGQETLKSALANSCNCYYVNLIQELGKDKIIEIAKRFGFDSETNIFDNWSIKNSSLPSSSDLSSLGELSLMSFGQGRITSSPIQLCTMMCELSSGYSISPRLVIGTVDKNGKIRKFPFTQNTKIFNYSDKMNDYMRYVVSNGTGYYADDSSHKSAGKTATIETSNSKVNNTCFAGIYPNDSPKYAIVIMCENGKSGAEDCCPIFRTIVENLK